MNSFKSLIITVLLIGLSIIGMLSFMGTLQLNNHATQTIFDDPTINRTYGELYTSLLSAQGISESQRAGFEGESPIMGTDSFLFSSIIGAGKIFTTMISTIFSTIFVYVGSVLGLPPIVVGAFVSILLITIILLAWRLYKVGE